MTANDNGHRHREGRRTVRRILPLTLVLVLAGTLPALAKAPPASFADLAARLLPSVVNISTTQTARPDSGPRPEMPRLPPGSPFERFFRDFFDRQQQNPMPRQGVTSLGSGFVIDASGVIVTNNHVIAEADKIAVILSDKTRLDAKVIGRDAKTDIALLRIDPGDRKLKALKLGDSDGTRVGDWVLAIGNPFGLGGTVTAGIVSARQRDINAGPYDDFIQTDASINRGNSGGPMFNLAGEVIGINTAIFSPTGGSVGIGFAIPSNLAGPIVDQLLKYGRARRGYLGVRIQTVTDEIAQGLDLPSASGALVTSLSPGGPAAEAKVEVGDVILTFDGKPISEMRSLPRIVAETAVGREVDVVVWRQGGKKSLKVRLGEFPEDEPKFASRTPTPQPKDATVESLGLVLAAITPDLRKRFNLADDAAGVVVTDVKPDSPAAEKQIRPGDIIRKIGPKQSDITDPSQVGEAAESARKAKRETLLVLVERERGQHFIALKLAKG